MEAEKNKIQGANRQWQARQRQRHPSLLTERLQKRMRACSGGPGRIDVVVRGRSAKHRLFPGEYRDKSKYKWTAKEVCLAPIPLKHGPAWGERAVLAMSEEQTSGIEPESC